MVSVVCVSRKYPYPPQGFLKIPQARGVLKATFLKRILLVLIKTEISRGFFLLEGR